MASVKWRMKGQWIKNCNCAYGCPCDFNALPTHGNCQCMVAMKIQEGHFDKTDLSCLSWATRIDFPGAPHRIRVVMPGGFEHHEGEIASARTLKVSGAIKYSFKNTHSTLAKVDHVPKVVAHPAG